MRLYLVQHGDALSKDVDPERPLSDRGRRDVTALAGFLRDAGIQVRALTHSGKLRSRQTADILARDIAAGSTPELLEGTGPNDPLMPFAELAAAWDEDTLCVGHLPFMARAACLLLTGDESHAAIGFTPGSLVCLERDPGGPWGLAWMLRPELFSR